MRMSYLTLEETNLCVHIAENDERIRVYHLLEQLGYEVEPCQNPEYIRIKDIKRGSI